MKLGSTVWMFSVRQWRVLGFAFAWLLTGVVLMAAAAPWPEAWQRLETVLVRAPDHEAAWERLAVTVERAGRLAEWGDRLAAEASARAAGPEAAGWWALRARVAERMRDADAASAAWRRVAEASRAMAPAEGRALRRAVAAAAGRRGDWQAAAEAWASLAEGADGEAALAAWREAGRAAIRVPDGPRARQAWVAVAERAEPGTEVWAEAVGGLVAVGGVEELERIVAQARLAVADRPEAWLAVEEAAWPMVAGREEGLERAAAVLERLAAGHPGLALWLRRGAEAAAGAGRPARWAEALEELAGRGLADWGLAFDAWLAAGMSERAAALWERSDTNLRTGTAAADRELALARARGDGPAWLRLARAAHARAPADPGKAADRAEAAWRESQRTGDDALLGEVTAAWEPVLRGPEAAGTRAALNWAVGRGLAELAEAAALRWLEVGPGRGRAATEAVEALVRVGRKERARALAEANDGPWPAADAAHEAARRWRFLGEPERALTSLQRADFAFPGDFGLFSQRWQLLLELNRTDEAIGLFSALREAAPTAALRAEVESRHLRLLRGRAELEALVAEARAWSAGEPAQLAWLWRAALEADDAEALDRMRVAAAGMPLDLERARLLEETARRRGDGTGRLVAWQRLAREVPELALLAWREAASVAVAERLWDAAKEAVAELDRRQPGDPQVRRFEAEIAWAMGDRVTARRTLQQALQSGGGTPEIRWRLVQLLLEDGNAREAWPHLVAALREAGSPAEALPALIEVATALGRLPEALRLIDSHSADPFVRARRRAEVADLLGDSETSLAGWLEAARLRPEDADLRTRLRSAVGRAPVTAVRAEALAWLLRTETEPQALAELLVAMAAGGGVAEILQAWERRVAPDASAQDWWRLRDALGAAGRATWEALVGRLAAATDAPWGVIWVHAEAILSGPEPEKADAVLSRLMERRMAPVVGTAPVRVGPDALLQQALNARQRYQLLRGLVPAGTERSDPPATLAEAQVGVLVYLSGLAAESGAEETLFSRVRAWMEAFGTPPTRRAMVWLGMQARRPLMDEIAGFLARGDYDGDDYRFLHEVLVNTRLADKAGVDGPRLRELEEALAAEVVRREPSGKVAFMLANARRQRNFGRREEAGRLLRGAWEWIRGGSLGERLEAIGLAWETQQGDLARELMAGLRASEVRASSREVAGWLPMVLRSLGQGRDEVQEDAALRAAWWARALEEARRQGGGERRTEVATLWLPPFAHPQVGVQARAELAGLAAMVRPGPAGERLWAVAEAVAAAPEVADADFHAGYLAAMLAHRLGREAWAAAWWRAQAEAHPEDPWRSWAAARSALEPERALQLLPTEVDDPVLAAVVAVLRLELLEQRGRTLEIPEAVRVVMLGPPLSLPGLDVGALVTRNGGSWPPGGRALGTTPRPVIIPRGQPVAGSSGSAQAILERPVTAVTDEAAAAARRAAWQAVASGPEWAERIAERERQLELAPGAPRLLLDLAEAYEARAVGQGDRAARERALELWRRLGRQAGLDRAIRARVEGALRGTGEWRELARYLEELVPSEAGTLPMAALVEAARVRDDLPALREWAQAKVERPGRVAADGIARWLELGRALEASSAPAELLPYWRALAAAAGTDFPDDLRRLLVGGATGPERVTEVASWLADPFLATRRPVSTAVWLGRLAEDQVPRWSLVQGGPGGTVWPLGEMVLEAPPVVRQAVAQRLGAAPEAVRAAAGGSALAVLLALADGQEEQLTQAWARLERALDAEPAPPGWAGMWLREMRRMVLQHLPATARSSADPLAALLESAMLEVGSPAAALNAASVAIWRGTFAAAEWGSWLERLPTGGAEQDPVPHLELVRSWVETGRRDLATTFLGRVAAAPGAMAHPAFQAALTGWRVRMGETAPGWSREPWTDAQAPHPPGPAWRVTSPTGLTLWYRLDETSDPAFAPAAEASPWLVPPPGPRLRAPGWSALQSGETEPLGLAVRARGDFFHGGTAWSVRASAGRPGVWAGTPQAWSGTDEVVFSVWVRSWPGSAVRLGWRYLDADGRHLRSRLSGPVAAVGAWQRVEQRLVARQPLPARGDREAPPAGTVQIVPFIAVQGEAEVAGSDWVHVSAGS